MKRKIEIQAGGITVTAVIDTKDRGLRRAEVELVRDDLADALQEAVTRVRYMAVPRNRVRVL